MDQPQIPPRPSTPNQHHAHALDTTQKTFNASVHMQSIWDQHHQSQIPVHHSVKPHEFAVSIAPYIKPSLTAHLDVLELGCGMGSDALYFAELGAKVTSVDISQVAIDHNTKANQYPNLTFQTLDFSQPLPFAAESYDAVYAHLSLHYFDLATTESIFAEIARVLRPDGMLYFACESSDDPEYGQGNQVEPGVFVHADGHTRHFFSIPYTQALLAMHFDIVQLGEGQGVYRGEPSVFLYCWVKKRHI